MVVFAGLLCVPAVDCDCTSGLGKRTKTSPEAAASLAESLLDKQAPSRHSMAESIGLEPQESTPCQALKTLDCWLLMWADSWAQASGMMISTNLGQLVEASGSNSTAFFVSIFSVGNCMGRALIGLSSDAVVRRGVPRSVGLVCVSTTFTLMGLLGTHINSTWLVTVVVVLGGLGMGAINGLEPAIVSEMVSAAKLVSDTRLLVRVRNDGTLHALHDCNADTVYLFCFINFVECHRAHSLGWRIWVQTICFYGLGSLGR